MNVELINPFIASLNNVLTTMGGVESQPGKPSLKNDNISLGEVTGIIDMSGPQLQGSMAISFTQPVIFKIVENMVGEKLNRIDDTVTDLVGELTNMTAGGAKNQLTEKGYDIDMATPKMLSGKQHHITHTGQGKILLIPFSTASGNFFIELCFEDKH